MQKFTPCLWFDNQGEKATALGANAANMVSKMC